MLRFTILFVVPVTTLLLDAVTSCGLFPTSGLENFLPYSEEVDTIVGGYNVTIEDHPHQVAILFIPKRICRYFLCGGMIISENYIMTAAHCLIDKTTSSLELRAGSTYRNKGGIMIPIAELISHPDFTYLDKDVGLIKAAEPIQFSKTVQPIQLPPKGRPMVEGTIVTVTGWGKISEDNFYLPKHLLAVELQVQNFDKCKEVHAFRENVTENMWCADSTGKGTCNGDSGGPVTQDGMVVGIVSFGLGCANPKYPKVFTNIAAPAVRDFITEHTGL